MSRFKKVYLIAPHGATGGIELCHQLIDYLRNKGQDAYILYKVGKGSLSFSNDMTVTEQYSKYNIAVTNEIEDIEQNLLVLPEVMFDYIYVFHNIKIGAWWMSVDNRYACGSFWNYFTTEKRWGMRIRIIKRKIIDGAYNMKNDNKLLLREDKRIFHFYQSHYAQCHLYSLGFSKVLPLSDYINVELMHSDKSIPKEDIVLYNPSKGIKFTKKIIQRLPDIKFVALKGFKRDQLNEILSKSKLYIDFGEFPGKDRLPREAAMHDCCIITGKNGASFYYEDLPLLDKYKFEARTKNLSAIAEAILYVLKNYDSCIKDFQRYKRIISKEQEQFYQEIDEIFFS